MSLTNHPITTGGMFMFVITSQHGSKFQTSVVLLFESVKKFCPFQFF